MDIPRCGEKAGDEKMRITVFVILILTTIVLIGIFWLPAKPEKARMKMPEMPPMEDKGMDEPKRGQKIVIMPQPAPRAIPESHYQKAKKEISSWLEIGGKISPMVTMILAVRMARKKKGKR